MTALCELALRYGSDKAKYYTPFYDAILGMRRLDVKRVLEIGVGYPELMQEHAPEGTSYVTGASLRMWRDYFPNAMVVGLDKKRESLFAENRISCYYLNQTDASSYDELSELDHLWACDLIVDDGCHEPEAQLMAVSKLMPHLNWSGLYIIEDVSAFHAANMLAAIPYPCKLKEFGEARVIVVRHPKI